MDQACWVDAARERIRRKVAWLENRPDGLLHDQRAATQRLLVIKQGTEIRLHFAPLSKHRGSGEMSGRMSELDLKDPLFPFVPYTQGMMLTLLWRDDPSRVYLIGFGAGRVPTILHAHLPNLASECTEIEPDILPIAEKYFGYIPDERMKVAIQDGREYLAGRSPDTVYDFIHIDAFKGLGQSPVSLGTTEFYALCKQHLAEGGVVSANLVASDPLFRARVDTMSSAFAHVYLFVHEDATVIFGSDAPRLDSEEFRRRAQAIEACRLFAFPMGRLAGELRHVADCQSYLDQFGHGSSPLTDTQPAHAMARIPASAPVFAKVGRNDPCPCGSGRKYKKCHGR